MDNRVCVNGHQWDCLAWRHAQNTGRQCCTPSVNNAFTFIFKIMYIYFQSICLYKIYSIYERGTHSLLSKYKMLWFDVYDLSKGIGRRTQLYISNQQCFVLPKYLIYLNGWIDMAVEAQTKPLKDKWQSMRGQHRGNVS